MKTNRNQFSLKNPFNYWNKYLILTLLIFLTIVSSHSQEISFSEKKYIHDEIVDNFLLYLSNLEQREISFNDKNHYFVSLKQFCENSKKFTKDTNLLFNLELNLVDSLNLTYYLRNYKIYNVRINFSEFTEYKLLDSNNKDDRILKDILYKDYDKQRKLHYSLNIRVNFHLNELLNKDKLYFNFLVAVDYKSYNYNQDILFLSGDFYKTKIYPSFNIKLIDYIKIRFYYDNIISIKELEKEHYIVETEKGNYQVMDKDGELVIQKK